MYRDPGDRAGKRGGNRGDQDVVVADVRKLVRDHAFELVVIHQFHQARGHGHRSVRGIAARCKCVRSGLRNHVQLRHRQPGFGGQPLHHFIEPRKLLARNRLRAAGLQRDLVGKEIRDAVHHDGHDEPDGHALLARQWLLRPGPAAASVPSAGTVFLLLS